MSPPKTKVHKSTFADVLRDTAPRDPDGRPALCPECKTRPSVLHAHPCPYSEMLDERPDSTPARQCFCCKRCENACADEV